MPTYTQLRTEWYFDAEVLTPEMDWLCDELAAGLMIPRVNVGAKGDNLHLNGGHRSQHWILNSRFCTNRTYTVWGGLPPDLMHCLGAIDITPRDREQMLLISQRIDAASRAGLIEEVVAWYGNTNNDTRVDGWDNIRNVVATSDSSHLWHLHLTFNRWALRQMEVMRRLAAILLGRPIPGRDEEMLFLAQVVNRPSVWAGSGTATRDVRHEQTVRDLLSAGADGRWLSGYYNSSGRPFTTIEDMLDRLGPLVELPAEGE